MEKARTALLAKLAEYRKIRPHDITVVFDGYKSGMATQQDSCYGGVHVIFTRVGERADDVIKKTVSLERRGWIVVTADRDIVDHAWSAGSAPVPPDRFMAIIERRCREAADEVPEAGEEDDDGGNEGPDRRGNPHRLSKRERLIRKVLTKL